MNETSLERYNFITIKTRPLFYYSHIYGSIMSNPVYVDTRCSIKIITGQNYIKALSSYGMRRSRRIKMWYSVQK